MISILSVVYGIITFAVPGVLRTCIGTVYAEVENSSNGDHLPIFPQDSSAVVIIGGAGFIGSSLASALLDKGLKHLSVLDSFNIDKSVITKRHRAEQLFSDHGFNIDEKEIDMCVAGALFERLQQHSFTHITLLAPPAKDFVLGEQKISNKLRDKYESDSTRCFTTVLDAIVQAGTHHGTIPKLVFALPALSRSEELDSAELHERELRLHYSLLDLAQLYHARHGLVSVGLRLTDVYGPGDNPGSDVYRYASQAMRGVPIVLSAQQAKKQYHFTYIDDVVEGIISAMNYPATSPTAFELINDISFGHLDLLKAIAWNAQVNVSLTKSNTLSTEAKAKADTNWKSHFEDESTARSRSLRHSESQSLQPSAPSPISFLSGQTELNFQASVGFKSGMGRFIEWFRRTESRVFPCASECATPRLCFRSTWDSVAETSKELTQGCQNVFYTVAIGDAVDIINPLPKFYEDQSLRCNIAFVNRNSTIVRQGIPSDYQRSVEQFHTYENWTMVFVDDFQAFSDPRKPTRVPKLSPGKFFASTVQHAVYFDSKLVLTCDPREYIERMRPVYKDNRGHAVGMLAVHIIKTLFQHIDFLLDRSSDRPSITYYDHVLVNQEKAYLEYSERYGMEFANVFDGGFLIHNVQSRVARDFRCDWYREYQHWADRDQAAGAFVLAKRTLAMGSETDNYRHKQLFKIGREQKLMDDGVEGAEGVEGVDVVQSGTGSGTGAEHTFIIYAPQTHKFAADTLISIVPTVGNYSSGGAGGAVGAGNLPPSSESPDTGRLTVTGNYGGDTIAIVPPPSPSISSSSSSSSSSASSSASSPPSPSSSSTTTTLSTTPAAEANAESRLLEEGGESHDPAVVVADGGYGTHPTASHTSSSQTSLRPEPLYDGDITVLSGAAAVAASAALKAAGNWGIHLEEWSGNGVWAVRLLSRVGYHWEQRWNYERVAKLQYTWQRYVLLSIRFYCVSPLHRDGD